MERQATPEASTTTGTRNVERQATEATTTTGTRNMERQATEATTTTDICSIERAEAEATTTTGSRNIEREETEATATTIDPGIGRCSVRGCRIRGDEKFKCAVTGCNKLLHLECFETYVLVKHSLHPLPGGNHNVACTKLHHIRAAKELSGGGDKQVEGGRKGNWESDGKGGPNDPHTSMKILLDWWMTEGSYSKFCGKRNDGVKKIEFCNHLAAKITAETTGTRDGKNVLNKIQHIERSFKEAHNFAESETGAGILENDGETTFQDLIKKKCPFYYDIHDIMIDRASTRPKTTNYDLNDDDDEEEEDFHGTENVCHQDNIRSNVRTINTGTPTSVGGVSDVSEVDGDGRTTSSRASKAKRRKKSSLLDDDAITMLGEANQRSTERMNEMVRHHKSLEAMEAKKLELQMKHDEAKLVLEEKREEREQKSLAFTSWNGKNAELDYKMNLLKRYNEMKKELQWSDEQILGYCPEMEQVITSYNK